jgi:hypothetical protein
MLHIDIYIERIMCLIVLPYIQSRSQGNEIKLCLNGWKKNCLFDYHFVVIGEFDQSLKDEYPWVEFMKCKTRDEIEGQYNPHLDIQHKMETVMEKFGDTYDGFIRVADDNYAIKPFELSDITTVHYRSSSDLVYKKYSPTSSWSHDKWKTKELLEKEGLRTLDYTIHYPSWYEFSKLKEIWDKFNMRNESYVLEDVYFNYFIHEKPILGKEIRLNVLNSETYTYVLSNALSNPNIKFICNSENGWSKELDNELQKIINN